MVSKKLMKTCVFIYKHTFATIITTFTAKENEANKKCTRRDKKALLLFFMLNSMYLTGTRINVGYQNQHHLQTANQSWDIYNRMLY